MFIALVFGVFFTYILIQIEHDFGYKEWICNIVNNLFDKTILSYNTKLFKNLYVIMIAVNLILLWRATLC